MRVLERGTERTEVEVVDTTVIVRRFEAGAMVAKSAFTCESLLRAKFRADITCSREIADGFVLVGDEEIIALSHADLLTAIVADPADHDSRLVLADWLTDRGDPWGQIIALQHLKEHTSDDARYDELDRTDLELRIAHAPRLWGPLANPAVGPIHSEWECGFVREVMIESLKPERAPAVIDTFATLDVTRVLRSIHLAGAPVAALAPLAAHRWPHLTELNLGFWEGLAPQHVLPVLAESCTPALEVLSLERVLATDRIVDAITSSPLAARLRGLALLRGQFSPNGLTTLAGAAFPRLETLQLTGRGPRDADAVLRTRARHVTVDLHPY